MSGLARRNYRDLIARHPKSLHYHNGYARLLLMEGERAEVEAWLLWGNSLAAMEKKARGQRTPGRVTSRFARGAPKQVAGMFSALLEESGDDDMFTLALDGLLNARAGSPVLSSALRRVNERIALKPHKMFLYRLAADLHEELRRPDEMRMVLEQGLVVAEDARGIILRYENAGFYGKAGKLLRRLLIGNPFDVELLLRLGIMEEKKANPAAAGKAYLRALDLMIGRLPRLSRKVAGKDDQAGGPRYRRTYNLDEIQQYFELASQGLIISARTPETRRQLLDTIQYRVRTELKNLEADNAFSGTHGENPRLLRLTRLMRRLRTRAAGLLALAIQNSDGMLTGRLWIADLHRLLGQEEQAADIERELPRHDLLPMPRVPAELKAAAEKEGRDLAERLRKVSTLFLTER